MIVPKIQGPNLVRSSGKVEFSYLSPYIIVLWIFDVTVPIAAILCEIGSK
jgi:hypothetical protein